MNLINSAVVCKFTHPSLELRQQLNVVYEVAVRLRQLVNHTLSVVRRFSVLQHIVDTETTVLYEFTVFGIQKIWETEYLLIIGLSDSHYLFLVRFEVFIEYYEGSLIIEVGFVDDLDRHIRCSDVDGGQQKEHRV